jgi:hypothetical protein
MSLPSSVLRLTPRSTFSREREKEYVEMSFWFTDNSVSKQASHL